MLIYRRRQSCISTLKPSLSSRPFLRVVDELDPLWSSSYSKYAKVGIVENMSSIDSMSGTQCPFNESSLQKIGKPTLLMVKFLMDGLSGNMRD